MTDRIHSLVVVLEHDMRDDDCEALMNAICQFRWVVSVKGNVSDIAFHVAEQRAKHELHKRLWKAFHAEDD